MNIFYGIVIISTINYDILRKNKKRYDDIKAREQITRHGAFQHGRYRQKNKPRTDV